MTTPHSAPAERDRADGAWWLGAVIYQIYPRSFGDANGDGIGDLAGIIEHLDHLAGPDDALGVDAIWLSPIYPSPLHDFGYDITDYTDVAAEYGTLADLDRLVAAAHARGLKVLLDLVPCHTSVEHPWFRASRSSRDDPKRDWYLWADAAHDGGPPNNWIAAFGQSAWEWDEATGQYFLHSFYPEQPDLNWRNPAVAGAIHDAMRFWLARGIDGFRVDAIAHAIKDAELRDNPPAGTGRSVFGVDPSGHERLWNVERPEVHDVIRGMRAVADAHGGALLVGEVYTPAELLANFLGRDRADQFQLAFNFELLWTRWDADAFRLSIERSEAFTPPHTNPTYALSNHDNPRHASRYGEERAPLAALMLLTLRGTITLYAGEEIGMVDPPRLPGPLYDRAGRDPQRTPMQWRAERHGGFSSATPWLPLTDPERRSVAGQSPDPASLLSLYRRLIALRRASPALRLGEQRSVLDLAPSVVAWIRSVPGERILVLANMGAEAARLDAGRFGARGALLAGTDATRSGSVELAEVELAGLEGLVLRLEAND